jgi:Nuclease-related domain
LILKELPVPIRLILTEILARRLVIGHIIHPIVQRDLAKRWAGHWGEIALANYVKELPPNKYYIFHDLQLKIHGVSFQIDTLLISTNFVLIIEAKNIAGTVIFDNDFKQLIRQQDGNEEIFEDPRIQAIRNQSLLKRFFINNGINPGPIEYLVFFSNVKIKLKAAPGNQSDLSKVCKARELFLKIEEFETAYPKEKISPATIDKMGELLLCNHKPLEINILNEYKITSDAIRTGVRCPNCSCIPMIYVRGKWFCRSCQITSKDAYLEAVNDYFHLYKPSITNAEIRTFLHLPSNDIAQKILYSLNLVSTGKTKNRVYYQSLEKQVNQCVLK